MNCILLYLIYYNVFEERKQSSQYGLDIPEHFYLEIYRHMAHNFCMYVTKSVLNSASFDAYSSTIDPLSRASTMSDLMELNLQLGLHWVSLKWRRGFCTKVTKSLLNTSISSVNDTNFPALKLILENALPVCLRWRRVEWSRERWTWPWWRRKLRLYRAVFGGVFSGNVDGFPVLQAKPGPPDSSIETSAPSLMASASEQHEPLIDLLNNFTVRPIRLFSARLNSNCILPSHDFGRQSWNTMRNNCADQRSWSSRESISSFMRAFTPAKSPSVQVEVAVKAARAAKIISEHVVEQNVMDARK